MPRCFVVLTALICLAALPACGDELVWATGRVISQDTNKPIADATVAVFDDQGHVLDYARTDADGTYTLAIPRSALHLTSKHGGGFLHEVAGGVGRLIGGAAGPIKYGIRAAASAASVSDPLAKFGVGAASGLAQSVVDSLAPSGHPAPKPLWMPGSVLMRVTAPGRNDAIAVAHVYWMEQEVFRVGGKETRGLCAWFDPARLSGASDNQPSTVASPYLLFADARIEPGIAQPGDRVVLSVRLPLPPQPATPVVVVARDARMGRIYQLYPDGQDTFRCDFEVDKRFPKNDHTFCILAYAAQPGQPGRSKKVEAAIERAGLWDPRKPYRYDPLLVASRNRAEVTITVVPPLRDGR
ncbi:MAG: carboxypeptidase-like regulatory domain-containing protein [Chthonomonadales bacterium]